MSPTLLSVKEYLELEERAELRHEYVDGRLLAVAGETQEHEEIVLNLVEALRPLARGKGCRLYTTNIKLQVRPTRFRYPDLMVICSPKVEPRIEFTPCLIVEVLSDSTEQTDLSEKLSEYTALPSLERYLLVSQTHKLVLVYIRQTDGWRLETLENSGEVYIPCLDASLTLEEIYRGLAL